MLGLDLLAWKHIPVLLLSYENAASLCRTPRNFLPKGAALPGWWQKWSNMSSTAWFNSMRSSQCVSVYNILEIRIFKYWRSMQCTSIVLTFFYAIITTDSSACPYVSNLILIQGNNEKVHYWGKTNSSWPVFLIFLGDWIAFSVDNTRLSLGFLWTSMNNKNVSANVLSARGKQSICSSCIGGGSGAPSVPCGTFTLQFPVGNWSSFGGVGRHCWVCWGWAGSLPCSQGVPAALHGDGAAPAWGEMRVRVEELRQGWLFLLKWVKIPHIPESDFNWQQWESILMLKTRSFFFFFFFFLFSFSFAVCMSGFNQSLLCEMFQLGLNKLFALLWYGPVDYRWNYIKRLQRLIMPESFQYSPHQLTLSAHYINNLGEAIISKARVLHLPSLCTCISKISYMLVHLAWPIYA